MYICQNHELTQNGWFDTQKGVLGYLGLFCTKLRVRCAAGSAGRKWAAWSILWT